MSVPALRQPKTINKVENKKPTPSQKPCVVPDTKDFLIITLKGGRKLVVSSDAYHGILTAGELYKCVFCEKEMVLDLLCKERHKTSQNHRKILENHPHVEDYKENLIRKLTSASHYCTICNVVVSSQYLFKHLETESHIKELQQACLRAESYKPNALQAEAFPPLPKK
ncbi:uncharacterized protein LOC142985482 [Anticarsia gemmatalis]|uniref:uncharacterized protein LOC142985482 n=1 Tax=Anticarsia gemmatalis TaxID=129554 RepID=UPI003F763B9E